MEVIGISLGSNLGNREKNLESARSDLFESGFILLKLSRIYETLPLGFQSAHIFLNQFIIAQTDHSPDETIMVLQSIEKKMGRKRDNKIIEDRSIDLDLIFFGDQIINQKNLQVPHPRMHERLFVLMPLCDIYPEWIHPQFKKSARQMMDEIKNTGETHDGNLIIG